MIPVAIVAVASTALSLVVGYAFWIRFHVLDLQADLLDILADLSAEAKKIGRLEDPAYAALWRDIWALQDFAPSLTLSGFLYTLVEMLPEDLAARTAPRPVSADPAFREVLERLQFRVGHRLLEFLFAGTLTGFACRVLLLPLAVALWKKPARQRLERTVTASLSNFTRPMTHAY